MRLSTSAAVAHPRLIDAVLVRERQVVDAVRVGVDDDRHPGGDRAADVLVAQVQPLDRLRRLS